MVTKADLPKITDRTLPNGSTIIARRPSLYCPECGETFSATPGDYWGLPEDYVFRCEEHDRPLELVLERTVIVPWAAVSELTDFLEATWDAYGEDEDI